MLWQYISDVDVFTSSLGEWLAIETLEHFVLGMSSVLSVSFYQNKRTLRLRE